MTLTDEQAEQVISHVHNAVHYWQSVLERMQESDTMGRMMATGKRNAAAALLKELEGLKAK